MNFGSKAKGLGLGSNSWGVGFRVLGLFEVEFS